MIEIDYNHPAASEVERIEQEYMEGLRTREDAVKAIIQAIEESERE